LRVKSSGALGGEKLARRVRFTENNATYSGIRGQGHNAEKISAQKTHGRTLGCDRARPGSEIKGALQFQSAGILKHNHLNQAHSNAGEHDKTIHCPDSNLNSSTEFRIVKLIQWIKRFFFGNG